MEQKKLVRQRVFLAIMDLGLKLQESQRKKEWGGPRLFFLERLSRSIEILAEQAAVVA